MATARIRSEQETPYVGPRWWVAGLGLLAALIFQETLAQHVFLRDAVPSGILVVVVWYAIRADTRRAAIFGLIAGLCEDVLAMNTGAAWMLATLCVAIVVARMTRDFFADSLIISALTAGVATLVRNVIFWIVMSIEGYPSGLAMVHFHQTMWQAVLNAVLMFIIVFIIRRWEPHSSEKIRRTAR